MAQQAGFQKCRVTITSYKNWNYGLTNNNLAQEFTILSVPNDSNKGKYLVRMLSNTNNTNKNSNYLKYNIITRNQSLKK